MSEREYNTSLFIRSVSTAQHIVRALGDFSKTLVPTNPLASDCNVLRSSPSSTPLIDLISDSVIVVIVIRVWVRIKMR